ncbi:MAG: DUF2891 domain-containing protein [Weeksellaceae bacterium]|nr:DUF2891 domain-containing protein [Weeksellaceae bacterium]
MIRSIYLVLFVGSALHAQALHIQQADMLMALPQKCIQHEYPNKLSQVLADSTELQSPAKLHPAFYGCFDWHSSVHGHWSMVYLMERYPNLRTDMRMQMLQENLSKENIAAEIAYFSKPHEYSYERPYGWNWLLKLQLELDQSSDPQFQSLGKNLQELSNLIAERYIEFLPKLLYPQRSGTHSSTAFGLIYAWDYAVYKKDEALQNAIRINAKRLFLEDSNCPYSWEPSGTDFLSPCMEEISIMHRVLEPEDFLAWAQKFMPQLLQIDFQWSVAEVSDRTDGHLVHLDGLNFSRARVMRELSVKFPNQYGHLDVLAQKHYQHSWHKIFDGNYEGEHWLASFALMFHDAGHSQID